MSKSLVVRLAWALLMFAVVLAFGVGGTIHASNVIKQGTEEGKFREDRFLIQPAPESGSALAEFHRTNGTTVLREFTASGGMILLGVPHGKSVADLLDLYRSSGLVRFAEPDFFVQAACAPNDPKLMDGSLWSFWNYGQNGGRGDADIDAVEAWSLRTSATNVLVAIVDTGVRYSHEDLEENLWTNSLDGSFGTNATTGTSDPWDENGHGTQLAGIVGAVGNNGVGVAGVAWRARMMACKFLDNAGSGAVADGIACIEFARARGAKIINLSWGAPDLTVNGTNYTEALSNALAAARADDVVFVAAAGNANPAVLDTDVTPFFPASLPLDNIVSVASSTSMDNLANTSNYGATNVDLAAPGVGIFSTSFTTDSSYGSASGTSEATAMVTGALALVRAQFPADNYAQSIARILNNVDKVPALTGKCVSGGRLNLRKALAMPGGGRPAISLTCTNSNVLVTLTGTPCRGYVLETSTNFTDWVGVATNLTSNQGVMSFVADPDLASQQFFRAYAEP